MLRRVALLVAFALALAACASDPPPSPTAEGSPDRPADGAITALLDPDHPDLPTPNSDTSQIISGGPPPDGIPSIDAPVFASVDETEFLTDSEPVLVLTLDGATKVYPVQILIWHEIVNDSIADRPVSVTYCPLCNSAVAFDRQLGDQVLDFGTSGKLYQSALVMYDRQTESLWSHFSGEAVAGELTGTELERFPLTTASWADAREAFPDAEVLTTDTGFDRSYGSNPYPGYDDVGSSPFLFQGEIDGRLAAKERVVGIDSGSPLAVRLDAIESPGVLTTEAGDLELVVFRTPGTASALDDRTIGAGNDVGATGVFEVEVDGERLQFAIESDRIVDTTTGSSWNVFGEAVDGPLAGTTLTAVEHVDTFWFAWAAFQPDTVLVVEP
jgi:hypothetical protein